MNRLFQLSEHLYRYSDSCNVYIIKSLENDREATLIDVGTGAVFDVLHELGVERVTDILVTHHHRDQVQGAPRAFTLGARIWVPHAEQNLFHSVHLHWQARPLFNNYNVRQDRFSLLEPVSITGALHDYDMPAFAGLTFFVLPTPGHTPGSVTYLTHIDQQRIAFTGDLIYAPGKVWSLAATQWSYNGLEGLAAGIASLLDLKERGPRILLPSHGDPIEPSAPAIDLLVERLWEILAARGWNKRLFELRDCPYQAITEHLLWNRTAVAYNYVLRSDSGKAIFFDFGYDFTTGSVAGEDRAGHRPSLYTMPALRHQYGISQIEAVIPTHSHDDHVAGFNLLREVEQAEVWASDSIADVLERPADFDLPCLWYDPIPVARRLPVGEPIRWCEHTFTLYPLPGHTHYAVGIFMEVDGKRILISGDQYEGNTGLWPNYVYQNRMQADDFRASAALYRKLQPDIVLSGHWTPLQVTPEYLDQLDALGEDVVRWHHDLLPEETAGLGPEGAVARITPYQATSQGGAPIDFEVELCNPFDHEAETAVNVVAPFGWQLAGGEQRIMLAPGHPTTLRFGVTPPARPYYRARLAVNVTVEGMRFGQAAEALVTVM